MTKPSNLNVQAVRYAIHLTQDILSFKSKFAGLNGYEVEGDEYSTTEALGCLGADYTRCGAPALLAFAVGCHGAARPSDDGQDLYDYLVRYCRLNADEIAVLYDGTPEERKFTREHPAVKWNWRDRIQKRLNYILAHALESNERLLRKYDKLGICEVIERFEAPHYEAKAA